MLLLNMVALLTYSIVERQLRQQGCPLTTRRAIAQLATLTLVETHYRDGSVLRRLSAVTPEQQDLVRMLDGVLQPVTTRVVEWLGLAAPLTVPLLLPPAH